MSLIHEALKKLEGSNAHAGAGQGGEKAALTSSHAPMSGKSRGLRLPIIIAVVALLCSAAGVYVYLGRGAQIASKTPVVSTPGPRASVTPSAGPAEAVSVTAPAEVRTRTAAESNDEGIFLYNTKRYADAAARFKEAIDKAPENAVYRNNLALALMRSGSTAGARNELERALKLSPEYPEALNNLGTLLASTGDHTSALKRFNAATAIDAAYAEPHLNAAVSYELTGRTTDAIAAYERFLALSDDAQLDAKVKKKVARLRAALIISERSKGAGAVR